MTCIFDEFRQWSTLESGFNSRLLDQIKVIAAIGKLIEDRGIENVFFLGDLFNSFSSSLPKSVYNAAYYFMKTLAERANLFVIVGNHDVWRGLHILDPYREMENVNIVMGPITNYAIEGHRVDMIPWGFELPPRDKRGDVLMAHVEVKGAVMNATGIRTTDGITQSSLEGYKYVFLGHYHERQILDVPHADWAGYIGSVMQINMSSSPDSKGVTLVEGTGELSRTLEVSQIDVPSPRIWTRTIVAQEQVPEIVDLIKERDYWRLTVTEPDIKLPLFDHRVQIEFDLKPKVEYRLEERVGESLKETVTRFIEGVETKVDRDLAIRLLDWVMQ